MPEILVFATLNGLVTGLLLFMLASGLTVIFSMMGVLNFAHASFYMLGAYFAYSISLYFGYWTGLIVAPLIVGVLGALVERYGLRRVHQHGHVAELVFTFGLAFLIEEAVQFFWGADTKNYQTPDLLDFPLFTLFGQEFSAYRGFMLAISLGIFIGLYQVLTRSRVGLIIQAAITHPHMVSNLGHNVPLIFTAVFGVGTALAGLAGVIAGPVLTTFPGMALVLGSIVFVIVVIGGLGSLPGAFLASLLIGLLQSYAIAANVGMPDLLDLLGLEFPRSHPLDDLWTLNLAQIAPILPFLLLVLVLIFRPTGLMGKREQ
ncbi:MAG: branched-chain amino acid ABC transporter permease [Gammaproteobacteria bacterium]|nr:branched-chain amino acid ABC transporter permease [Gammaproteobacteria bacterium]MDE0478636.1 branched-chain amino acid ABC transporter permease [Gammaproteobacteria bacterium]MDE0507466.1 branched-chain amino acid ABC transporter permease [Gammaproteobacteria bacterium]MXX05668.1 branched-chain amino acid ABC transporter permease [Gammaproteobacteria bacterium]MXY91168.1 branched-chain amino acid ABC transporter permease [Gammaproteobacteria bacterium]